MSEDDLPQERRGCLPPIKEKYEALGWKLRFGRPKSSTYSTSRVIVRGTNPTGVAVNRGFDEGPGDGG